MFFTDLDRTILFSNRFIENEEKADIFVVEEKEGRSISYMKKNAYERLNHLIQQGVFIPSSARTYNEMLRISFIRENLPEWMIAESGRVIYYKGEPLKEWDEQLSKQIDIVHKYIKEAQKMFRYLTEEKCHARTWHVSKEVIMTKTVGINDEQVQELASWSSWFRKRGCILYVQERKAYLIPFLISKANAVEFLIGKLQPDTSISAGDSDMDVGMFDLTTYSIAPLHHTIQKLPSHVLVTKETGLDAGENILSFAMNKLC